MKEKLIRVLLVEDNPGDARLMKEYLSEPEYRVFELTHKERLSQALECLEKERFDVILLDLMLSDSKGYDTFIRIYNQAAEVPVVVLSGLYDETMAIKAVHEGAQDYLVKGQVDGNLLRRSLHYAIERHKMQLALRSQSLIDDLTRLYNRRGFITLADQQLKLSQRNKRGFYLVFVDLDGLKQVNDNYGHLEGDKALINSAKILKKAFRETDIIARIGGDEFMVLAIDASEDNVQVIEQRLAEGLKIFNGQEGLLYKLSLSTGIVFFDPKHPLRLEELMDNADKELYNHKRGKRGF